MSFNLIGNKIKTSNGINILCMQFGDLPLALSVIPRNPALRQSSMTNICNQVGPCHKALRYKQVDLSIISACLVGFLSSKQHPREDDSRYGYSQTGHRHTRKYAEATDFPSYYRAQVHGYHCSWIW